MNIAGVGGALLAALPGFADWLLGIPRGSGAKTLGPLTGPARGAGPGLGLAAAGPLCTVAAGCLGWSLVQSFHVGVRLTPAQERDEFVVQNVRPLPGRRGRAA